MPNQVIIAVMGDITPMFFPRYARAHVAIQPQQMQQVRQVIQMIQMIQMIQTSLKSPRVADRVGAGVVWTWCGDACVALVEEPLIGNTCVALVGIPDNACVAHGGVSPQPTVCG